jgi:hypothetical protein
MNGLKIGLLVLGLTSALGGVSIAQTAKPTVRVCLAAYSAGAGQARYRANVEWNGFVGDFARVDLAARDTSGAVWPQFHNERLRPGGKQSNAEFTVSDVSQYPLEFFLIGLTEDAKRSFDADCRRNGFCSLKLPVDGVEELGQGGAITGPVNAPKC